MLIAACLIVGFLVGAVVGVLGIFWLLPALGEWMELDEVIRFRDLREAAVLQAEPHTEDWDDKWLILACRILVDIGRDDVRDGLEIEFAMHDKP